MSRSMRMRIKSEFCQSQFSSAVRLVILPKIINEYISIVTYIKNKFSTITFWRGTDDFTQTLFQNAKNYWHNSFVKKSFSIDLVFGLKKLG